MRLFYIGKRLANIRGLVGMIRRASVASASVHNCRMRRKRLIRPTKSSFRQNPARA